MRSWVRGFAVAAGVLLLGGLTPPTSARLIPPLGLPIPPVSAGATPLGMLDRQHPVLAFSGTVDNPTPLPLVNSPVPVVCAVTCQEFTFTSASTRPFLAAVKDKNGSQNSGWNLSVYDPSDRLVGAANGVGANGQAIAVSPATRGTYRLFVTFTYLYDAGPAYVGEVRQMGGASWAAGSISCGLTVAGVQGCYALPILSAEPPHDFHVDGLPPVASTPLGFPIPVEAPTPTSCYADETIQLGATRCLRFTSNVRNVGAGRLDIRIPWLSAPGGSGFLPGQCGAEQVVRTMRGRAVVRPAGPCEFHPAHAHFHYKDLVGFSLHALMPGGAIGPQVGNGLKESFCLGDNDYFGFGTAAPNGPRTYAGQPDCNVPASLTGGTVFVEEGITPGWGDVYTWDTPGQFIDITNVPAGRYVLVEKTNPSNRILVAGPSQTCAATELTLTATDVTATAAKPVVTCPT